MLVEIYFCLHFYFYFVRFVKGLKNLFKNLEKLRNIIKMSWKLTGIHPLKGLEITYK